MSKEERKAWFKKNRDQAKHVKKVFDQMEYKETVDGEQRSSLEEVLPVNFIAKLLHKYGRVPFETTGMDPQVQSVQVHIIDKD